MEKIDAIDANEDTSVINSGCCTDGEEPDEDIKEPNINSSPLECFSPISTGKRHSTHVCNKLHISHIVFRLRKKMHVFLSSQQGFILHGLQFMF